MTDIDLSGAFQQQWLIVHQNELAVLAEGRGPGLLRRLPVDRVQSFRAYGVIGSGLLQAQVDGMWVDLLRYSNTHADRFAKVARRLEDLRTLGTLVLHPEDEVDQRRCGRCGMTLQFVGDVCPRCINRGAMLAQVQQLIRPHRASAMWMCLLLIVGVVAELVPPKLQQYLVDHVLRIDNAVGRDALVGVLLSIVLFLTMTRVASALVAELKGRLSSRVGTAVTFDLRARMVEKLQKLSVAYYDRHVVGVLMSRVAYDTEAMHGLIQQITGGFLLQILQLVGVGIMLFTLNWKLALFTLIPMPLVIGGSWFFWRYVYPRYYRYWDSASKQAAALTSMLAGIRVVKAFGQEEREFERFKRSSEYLRRSRQGVELSTSTFSATMQMVFSLGGLIVWYVGGQAVLKDRMTLGALMAFLAYLAMFYSPLSTLAQLTAWLTSFTTASHRVFELLDTPVSVNDAPHPVRLERMDGRIKFENVTFGYDRHHPVLRNVSFEIQPGEMIGVVGRSGSGKTTVVNLISRFYDVDDGRVLIDSIDVRQADRRDLRRHTGIVLQEPFLFRGSVWDNLVYGQPDSTPEAAITAARAAAAHDFIMKMPLAYDSYLGERGAGLSGGERQRVSIARALLADPRILILDEATSNVDTESEKAIQDALKVLTRGRTTIAIAHRLSTLRHASRVFVFDNGKLVEQGPHAELLTAGGLYAKLVTMQTQLTAEPSVDRLSIKPSDPVPERARPSPDPVSNFHPRWLSPAHDRIHLGNHDALHVTVRDDRIYAGVFAVLAFPVARPAHYVSLRYSDSEGQEHEVGLVRDPCEWPDDVQSLLRQALDRRYFVFTITSVETIELEFGHLTFRVRTDRGPATFMMRWTQSQAQDYGRNGKILLDVDDNRYLVPDIDALPKRQSLLFRRFVYW